MEIFIGFIIILFFGLAVLLVKIFKEVNRPITAESICEEASEVTECRDEELMEVLTDAFRALRPNSLGRGSMEFLQLDAMIERIAYGREVSTDTALFLLSRIQGAEEWADKLRTGAGA